MNVGAMRDLLHAKWLELLVQPEEGIDRVVADQAETLLSYSLAENFQLKGHDVDAGQEEEEKEAGKHDRGCGFKEVVACFPTGFRPSHIKVRSRAPRASHSSHDHTSLPSAGRCFRP